MLSKSNNKLHISNATKKPGITGLSVFWQQMFTDAFQKEIRVSRQRK